MRSRRTITTRYFDATKRTAAFFLIVILGLTVLIISTLAGCTSASDQTSMAETPEFENGEDSQKGIPAEPVPGKPAERIDDSVTESDLTLADTSSANDGGVSRSSKLLVRFLDVGQGDAALISCDGLHMLIDGGPPCASSKIYTVLKNLEITKLDVVIATHPDADHCGGIAGALNYAECQVFYCPVTNYETRAFENILSHLKSPITVPSYGDSFNLGDAQIQFINPLSTKDSRSNNGSLVCLLTYGNTKFLFTGDAETESEVAMLNGQIALDSDVLKVGHHGSSTSSSYAFLKATSPKYAVISVGENNYGHPTAETLQKLAQQGIEVLRTDQLGTILFYSDGETLGFTNTAGLIEE